mmetsp:Transcript_13744/g.26329  ORF Transcript_13744/g.26329 Transcript_13744/m.26329 type:complete len:243 (+) Transcript_13744:512-1240(+)
MVSSFKPLLLLDSMSSFIAMPGRPSGSMTGPCSLSASFALNLANTNASCTSNTTPTPTTLTRTLNLPASTLARPLKTQDSVTCRRVDLPSSCNSWTSLPPSSAAPAASSFRPWAWLSTTLALAGALRNSTTPRNLASCRNFNVLPSCSCLSTLPLHRPSARLVKGWRPSSFGGLSPSSLATRSSTTSVTLNTPIAKSPRSPTASETLGRSDPTSSLVFFFGTLIFTPNIIAIQWCPSITSTS